MLAKIDGGSSLQGNIMQNPSQQKYQANSFQPAFKMRGEVKLDSFNRMVRNFGITGDLASKKEECINDFVKNMDFNDKFQKMVKYVRGLNGIKDEKVLIPSEVIEGWEDMVLKYSPSYNCGRDEITHRGSSREYFVCNLDSKAEESGISKIATTDTTRQIWPLDVYKSISEKCDDLIKVTNERFDILADSVIMKMVKKALKLPN